MQRKEIGGMACLVLAALIWGFAFVSQVQGMDSTTPLFFGATRFTLGSISLIPLLWFRRSTIAEQERKRRETQGKPSITLGNGVIVAMPKWAGNPIVVSIICGIVLFTASTVQQYGILYSGSAGRSGFITALYIVMTPLLAFVILRRRVHLSVIISVAISVIGFYLLCVTDGFGSITLADMVLLFTAVLFAGHILVIDTFGRDMDPILLSFGQITTTAIISWIGSIIEGSIDWAGAAQSWIAIVYAGVCSAGVAYTLQVIGQQLVPPTRASVINVARIVLLRSRRGASAGRNHDHSSLPRLRAHFRGHHTRPAAHRPAPACGQTQTGRRQPALGASPTCGAPLISR